MLKLKNVSKFYYNKGIIASGFAKVNLELKMGEFVVITGESGSGKSTLLNVISGLDSYEEGEMYLDGKETSHYTERDFEEYRRKYIANIFQNFNLINSYTVYQNIELGLLLNGYKKKEIKAKVLEMIEQVGLTKFKNTKISKLSGGQKQRVAIGRAMVKDTPIIVADEPTGNLDEKSAKEVIQILKKVAKGKLVILVTHNIEQVEEYATRIIKMHDGKIIEDREIKKIEENAKIVENKINKIRLVSKYRLGIRNTFNILTKFLLLFAVFLFIIVAVFVEYASFKETEYQFTNQGYNTAFKDLSDNRILIKKKDKTYFTKEDYDKIKKIENVDYIIEEDLLIDANVSIRKDDMYVGDKIRDIDRLIGKVDIGRKPESKNEMVLQIGRDHYYLTNKLNKLFENEFELGGLSNGEEKTIIKIVGIKYNEDNDYSQTLYATSELLADLRTNIHSMNSIVKILINNSYNPYYYIKPSNNVEKGYAIINNDLKYSFPNGNIKNKNIKIEVSNIYYNDELNLKVSGTYTKANFKKVTGYDKYEEYLNSIFINTEEYNSLYDKPPYQSSVYVKEIDNIDQTVEELANLGIKAKKISDYKVNNEEMGTQVLKLTRVVVTIVLIFVLFFISYFIIKIILKSRNIYYTTLRMLGASYKSIKRILDIELFANSTLAYIIAISFIILVKIGMIHFEYVLKLTAYIGFREYIFMYAIIWLMSRLISRKFSKKLFKTTSISTYSEEV